MDAQQINQGKRIRESYKINRSRKYIGQRMSESLRDYPQGSGSAYVRMDKVLALKDELKAQNKNVTLTAMFTKMASEGLRENPILNSALINGEEFFVYDSINAGVGIGLDEGIMMLVIKETQDKNIFEISDELQDGIARLKSKKLPFDRMMGSTFTISNMGMLGVEQFTPFLTPPETLIIGVGITRKQVVVNDDDTTEILPMTCISNSVNHAAVDGLHGGRFMISMKKIMENPREYMGV